MKKEAINLKENKVGFLQKEEKEVGGDDFYDNLKTKSDNRK